MPFGGGFGSGSLDGSSYVETPHATLVGHPGGADAFVPSGSGGPIVYTESPIGRLAGVGGNTDTMASPGSAWTEFPRAVLKAQPFVPEGYLPGGQVFVEAPVVALFGGPIVRDRLVSIEAGAVGGTLGAAVDDEYMAAAPGQIYFEIALAALAGVPSGGINRHVISDAPIASLWGGAGGGDVGVYVGNDSASTRGATGVADAHLSSSSTSASVRGTGGGVDVQLSTSSPTARLSVFALSGSSSFRMVEIPAARMVGTAGGADAFKVTEAPVAVVTTRGGGADLQASTQTPSAALRGTGGAQSSAIYAQASAAFLRGVAGGTDARQFIEAPHAALIAHPGGSNSHAASDGASARLAGVPAVQSPANDASGLIPALRWHVQQVFPGIQAPEGLPMLEIGRELSLPFVAIVSRQPSAADGPVFEPHETVPIDIVYVISEIPLLDNPAKVRDDLLPLRRRILADHHMRGRMGSLGAPSCLNVSVVATPFGRINQYQQHFAEQGQRLDVGVLSLEFLVRSD